MCRSSDSSDSDKHVAFHVTVTRMKHTKCGTDDGPMQNTTNESEWVSERADRMPKLHRQDYRPYCNMVRAPYLMYREVGCVIGTSEPIMLEKLSLLAFVPKRHYVPLTGPRVPHSSSISIALGIKQLIEVIKNSHAPPTSLRSCHVYLQDLKS